MKIKSTFLFCLLFSVEVVHGQQIPQFSQYLWNNYLINPAIGGAENYMDIKGGFRNQWVGMEGAPKTLFFTVQAQIGKRLENKEYIDVIQRPLEHKAYHGLKRTLGIRPRKYPLPPTRYKASGHHGVGGQIMNDRIGPFNTTAVYLSYAYHLPISKTITASLGAFFGIKQYSLNVSQLNFGNAVADQAVNTSSRDYGVSPDGSLGALIYSEKFYVGIATGQLLSNKISIANASQDLKGRLERHYFLNGGYRIKLNHDFALVPSAMVRVYVHTPTSVDLNLKINYVDVFWWGISYRHRDAIVGLIGLSLNKHLDIGYSYDYNTSHLSKYNGGTHEIVVGFRMINRKYNTCKPSYAW